MPVETPKSRQIHATDCHVGQRIRFQRQALGLSQADLATRIGVTFQQVQKYERGINRVSASKLYDMANVFGTPVTFFFDGLPDGPNAGPGPAEIIRRRIDYATSVEGTYLLDAFMVLPHRMRGKFLQLIRSVPGDD